MSNNLIRKVGTKLKQATELASLTEAHTNEVDEAARALAEMMLLGAEARPRPAQDRPRIILALDCTSSMGEFIEARKITSEMATTIATALFAEAGSEGLLVRLAYFRGEGDKELSRHPRQLRFSEKWYRNAKDLARAMTLVDHWPGWTQHCHLLRKVVEEAENLAIQGLVIVSDAFEERTPLRLYGDDLHAARVHARRLRDLGVKIDIAYKGTIRGGCPLNRAGISAAQAFRDIAKANDGRAFLLDPATIADRLGEIAAGAVLVAKGDAAGAQLLDVAGAQPLLEHHKANPILLDIEETVVAEQVAKCNRQK